MINIINNYNFVVIVRKYNENIFIFIVMVGKSNET